MEKFGSASHGYLLPLPSNVQGSTGILLRNPGRIRVQPFWVSQKNKYKKRHFIGYFCCYFHSKKRLVLGMPLLQDRWFHQLLLFGAGFFWPRCASPTPTDELPLLEYHVNYTAKNCITWLYRSHDSKPGVSWRWICVRRVCILVGL